MGVSTNGQICYGIKFEEGTEFPWDSDDFDNGINDWWMYEVHGFKHSFEMYTPEGEYIGGVKWPEDKVSKYYDEEHEFEKSHPLPVELVNYCSDEYPIYIIAIPETSMTALRGYPEAFDPAELIATDTQRATLTDFCKSHGIEVDSEPAWYLSSFKG